jgi:hypothetical protein
VAVLAAVTAAVAGTFAWWWWREVGTPTLQSVVVVFRAAGETVAADRPRRLRPGAVEAAAVVGFTQRGGPVRYLCALSPVEIGGRRIAAEPLAAWPDGYGSLRATWFTVEPAVFGWREVTAATAGKLRYADLLAPELGQGLLARPTPEAHNDDFLSVPVAGNTLPGGPIRLKVRVGAFRRTGDLLPRQAVASPGAAEVLAGSVPAMVLDLPRAAGVDPAVADVLRLGCFTFAAGVWPDGGPGWPLPLSPRDLVGRRLIATPEGVAAAAAAGDPLAAPWRASAGIEVRGSELRDAAFSREIRWGSEIRPGDAVTAGERWAALVADDGDGLLSLGDRALFAWLAPARFATLAEALGGPEAGAVLALRRR